MSNVISQRDKDILRGLAKRQIEIANSQAMKDLYSDWRAHGSFATGSRPMITIEFNSFANDIIPPLMQCETEAARAIEWKLHSNIANHTMFHDDTTVKNYFDLVWTVSFIPFGLVVKKEFAQSANNSSLGHHFLPVIEDLHEDFHKLNKSQYALNRDYSLNYQNFVNEIIGDILPAKIIGNGKFVSPTQNIIHFMSMENMFTAMYDYPDEFKMMMDMLTNDYLEFFDFMEKENVLLETTEDQRLPQGSYCFTNELPNQKEKYAMHDVWGYLDSQETVGISPNMFDEFVFPYYKRIADKYGLLSYGCCEPVDPMYEKSISKFTNLKKISISPWCNEEYMGEQLSGKKIIYHRKPSSIFLGVGTTLDEEAIKKHIEKTVLAAKGCQLEFSQRDVYSVNHSPEKVRRYIEIIRSQCN